MTIFNNTFKWIIPLLLMCTSVCLAESVASGSEEIYARYCASCHGRQLESFRSRTWTMDKTETAISAIVKNGIENKGMPSFSAALNDQQIKELAQYILLESEKTIDSAGQQDVFSTEEFRVSMESVFTEASVPWDIESLPDSSLLIADRDGDLFLLRADGKSSLVAGVPAVHNKGQGGLMDLCLHPDFNNNQRLFFSYSKPVTEDGKNLSTTAVCSATLKGSQLTDVKEIFEAKPYFPTNHHYGCRMVFDHKGYLYISIGDRGKENENPQNLKSDCGKVHRLREDGSIPEDNPFYQVPGVNKSIFTYGHRNPQGMAVHPVTGTIWENEHGPKGGDEVNLLKAGANYGWPVTTYGINYNGTIITTETTREGILNPEVVWIPSIAPCDAVFVNSDMYYPWKGDYLVPSLSFGYLNRCHIKNDKVSSQEKLFEEIGRMRSIEQAVDGYLYIGLENPGRVLRIRPLW